MENLFNLTEADFKTILDGLEKLFHNQRAGSFFPTPIIEFLISDEERERPEYKEHIRKRDADIKKNQIEMEIKRENIRLLQAKIIEIKRCSAEDAALKMANQLLKQEKL